jgi:DNA-directed RNA polymerase alpha subunit
MNPSIHNIGQDGDTYKFTLSGLNVSLANALRRTILSDIPINAIYTQTYADNECHIKINTTRLHNEILKQRLSCIPVHMKELDLLPEKYLLELDMINETDSMIIITTEDFRIKNKNNDNYLTKDETRRIFPPCSKTNMFIDFARLRPGMGSTIKGEQLKLTAEFSVRTAKDSSMFNVVSTCAYGNTVDKTKAELIWKEHENSLSAEQMSKQDIEMHKKNFYLLDAQRQFVEDSYDFVIQSVGVYDNKEIVKLGCKVLIEKMANFSTAIESDIVPIRLSETTMENCFDIVLENEDYTLGKTLEFVLYEQYFMKDKVLSFCGFKKFHPHDDESIIRLAYKKPIDKNLIRTHLNAATIRSKEVFEKIYKMF